jgi:hypothetical protein
VKFSKGENMKSTEGQNTKSVWVGLGVFGSLCFLLMGLPVLLAVGVAGFLSADVWLTLAVALAGFGGLAAYRARGGRGLCGCSDEDAPHPPHLSEMAAGRRRGL